ncbi:hypothetical protein ABEF95_008679 [Exophiala dermatitidis]
MAEAAKDHITDVVERSGGDTSQVPVTGFQVVHPSRADTTHTSRIDDWDYIDHLMITDRQDMDQLKKQMAYVLGEVQNLQSELQDLKNEIDERLWHFETGVKPRTTKPEFGQPELGSHRQASIAWITGVILKLHYDEQRRRLPSRRDVKTKVVPRSKNDYLMASLESDERQRMLDGCTHLWKRLKEQMRPKKLPY